MNNQINEQEILQLINRLNNDPQDITAAIALGNLYYDANEPAQAILYYNVALQLDPNLAGVRTDMGTMYWKNGNVALAEQAFRQVIEQFPGFGNAYLNLGLLLVDAKGNTKAGHAMWQELVDNYPEEPAAEKAKQFLAQQNLH